ncbi:hypothetical protein BDV98DRAFT_568575 [Pterulicium gracile]|uniref:Uncharacterized protein n=1 Tax=Pterulicium gracile TaxID=1884261 RepID=A0A5C3QGF2_9AGAR|nr:hypothetical protein BDV98DRAFT_568575 [Pterula gracilis]
MPHYPSALLTILHLPIHHHLPAPPPPTPIHLNIIPFLLLHTLPPPSLHHRRHPTTASRSQPTKLRLHLRLHARLNMPMITHRSPQHTHVLSIRPISTPIRNRHPIRNILVFLRDPPPLRRLLRIRLGKRRKFLIQLMLHVFFQIRKRSAERA